MKIIANLMRYSERNKFLQARETIAFPYILVDVFGESMGTFADDIRKKYLTSFSEHMRDVAGQPLYATDLIVFGIMDRSIGLVDAMPKLLADENIHAFSPLLRIQLDSLLRLHAFRIVYSREELASHVIAGKPFKNFKDMDGNKLTDRHLVSSLKNELPWVEPMYDSLCGWVHFSESHVFAAASEGHEDRAIEIGIGFYRKKVNPQIIEEATQAIKAIHEAIISVVGAYFALPRV
jgi:hypothetical protein